MIVRVVASGFTQEEELVRAQVENELREKSGHIESDNVTYEVLLGKNEKLGYLSTINIISEDGTASSSGIGANIHLAINEASKGFFLQAAKKKVKLKEKKRNKKNTKQNKQDFERKLNEELKVVTKEAKETLKKLEEDSKSK